MPVSGILNNPDYMADACLGLMYRFGFYSETTHRFPLIDSGKLGVLLCTISPLSRIAYQYPAHFSDEQRTYGELLYSSDDGIWHIYRLHNVCYLITYWGYTYAQQMVYADCVCREIGGQCVNVNLPVARDVIGNFPAHTGYLSRYCSGSLSYTDEEEPNQVQWGQINVLAVDPFRGFNQFPENRGHFGILTWGSQESTDWLTLSRVGGYPGYNSAILDASGMNRLFLPGGEETFWARKDLSWIPVYKDRRK